VHDSKDVVSSRGGVFVVADDFTGACDTGIVFREAGQPVTVSLNGEAAWERGYGQGVVQVKLTDTRKHQLVEATRRARAAVAGLDAEEDMPARVYQKIDSTMRGNVGAEINAILHALQRDVAVVCPAFPGVHRTVEGGRLMVEGIPISQTDYARDPRNPVSSDMLKEIVESTSEELHVIHATSEELPKTLAQANGLGYRTAVTVDAATDLELEQIAQILQRFPTVVPVGSAGLARPLARLWAPSPQTTLTPPDRPSIKQTIVACGSANPRSLQQVELLEASEPSLNIVRINPRMLTHENQASAEMERAESRICALLREDKILAIALMDDRMEELPYRGTFESFVADLVKRAVDASRLNPREIAVIVAGADTCLSVCERIGAETLYPQEEVVTGIPWSISKDGYNIISKAGGFGNDDALIQSVRYITNANNRLIR